MSKQEFKPAFGWWLFSLVLASGFGTAASTLLYDYATEATKSAAEVSVSDIDVLPIYRGFYEVRVVFRNKGDKPGVVTALEFDGKRYDSLFTSRVAGLSEDKMKDSYEQVSAAYIPGNGFTEVKLKHRGTGNIEEIKVEAGHFYFIHREEPPCNISEESCSK